MKQDVAPRSAARRLAAELKLPSWKGAVLCVLRPEGHVLIVAADKRWRQAHPIPSRYCGYPVIGEEPLEVRAQ